MIMEYDRKQSKQKNLFGGSGAFAQICENRDKRVKTDENSPYAGITKSDFAEYMREVQETDPVKADRLMIGLKLYQLGVDSKTATFFATHPTLLIGALKELRNINYNSKQN